MVLRVMKKVKTMKSFSALGMALSVFLLTLVPLLAVARPVGAVPDAARTLDTDRRKLQAALKCLNNSVIDTDDSITDFNDMFQDHRWAGADKNSSDAEISVWGLDRNDNGVAACKASIQEALDVLGMDSSDLGILSALTDGKYTNFNTEFPGSDLAAGWPKLRDKISQARDEKRQKLITDHGAAVYDYLYRERVWSVGKNPLVPLCYNVEHPDNASRPPTREGDFTVKLSDGSTANFLYKGDGDIRKIAESDNGGWYNDDGLGGRPTRIGDIAMQEDGSSYWPLSDGFYPLGDDRAIADKSFGVNADTDNGLETTKGIVTCGFIKDNKDFFFGQQFRFNTDKKLELVDPVANTAAGAPTVGGQQGGATQDNSCENRSGVMGWIMCPVIYAIQGALNFIDTQIQKLLTIDANYYDNDDIKGAWTNIKNLAYIILVPVMLVMVLGTALGFELVSAYTVKKALPRLVVATIFISLSYPICVFLIEFTNSVGTGTLGLLTQPFVTHGNNVNALSLETLFGGSVLTSIFAAPAYAIGAAILIWLFGGTLLLFTVVAFLTLLVRQMFIVALLLVAPLAILAWIFPGNDKFWKIWWGSFSKLLMMYPLIMALIAIGRIFAFVIDKSNPAGLDGAVLAPVMAMTAYVLPYAFIPFTFKFAGGAFATLAGVANDRSKGLFDRQRAKRGEKYGRLKAGDLPTALGGQKLGGLTSGIASGPRGWKGGRAGMRGYRETQRALSGQQQVEASQIWQGHKNDDKFLKAHANRELALEERNKHEKGSASYQAWDNAIKTADLVPRTAANRLASAQAWSASGYNFSSGYQGYEELAKTMADITGATLTKGEDGRINGATGPGAAAFRNAMNNAQYSLKNAGRFDLAGINDGTGYSLEKGIDKASGYTAGNSKTNTFEAVAQEYIGADAFGADGKLKTGQELADVIQRGLQDETIDGDKIGKLHGFLSDSFMSATGGNKELIRKQLAGVNAGVDAVAGVTGSQNVTTAVNKVTESRREQRRSVDPNVIET